MAAEESAPDSVSGVFKLTIKGTGREGEYIYLNSEPDYRAWPNLTLEIHPQAVPGFVEKYGAEPDEYLKDKTLSVSGEARRVTIWFTSDGKRTGKYYYQTHVMVTDEGQIEIL